MPLKAILKSKTVRNAACWLGAQYIRVVHATGSWQVVGDETIRKLCREGQPFIVSIWHGRILMMPCSWVHGEQIHMLISQHQDGQLIARIISYFGIDNLVGSTSKGGASALRGMLNALKRGECVGITPDGPRGPRMRASDGIISVARMAGVPIFPATYSVARGRILGSWDRFLIAAPFSRGVFVWGEPLYVDRNATADAIEIARLELEERMNAITRDADERVGRTPVTAAPAVAGAEPA